MSKLEPNRDKIIRHDREFRKGNIFLSCVKKLNNVLGFISTLSHIDEVKLLRKRARAFLARAIDSLNSGDYDVASFLSEQAVQLHLKSILLERLGDYPRTHSISNLISIIRRISNCELLIRFLEDSRMEVRLMEDAYISSRYLVKEFTKEEAEILTSIAGEVLKYG